MKIGPSICNHLTYIRMVIWDIGIPDALKGHIVINLNEFNFKFLIIFVQNRFEKIMTGIT